MGAEGITPGTVIGGDFVVVSEARSSIDRGTARFFQVEQRSTSQKRTLKLLRAGLLADAAAQERFAREARVGSKIASEHIAEVVATGVDDATGAWLVTEHLDGEDLAALIARGPIAPADARMLLLQMCHGVGAAHAAGVVHLDLRPETVFVSASHRADVRSTVKVLDFGVARVVNEALTKVGDPLVAPLWTAPELLEPKATVTARADVWSLGLVVFTMLTGKSFWLGANGDEILAAEVFAEALSEARPSASARADALGVGHLVPTGFDGWFARATARDAALRFPDANAAFRELDPVLTNASTQGAPLAPTAATLAAPPPSAPQVLLVQQTMVAAPYDLPASLAQFAAPRPLPPLASPPVMATHLGPQAPHPAPEHMAHGMGAQPHAPMYAPQPLLAQPARRGLKPPVIAALAAGGAAIIGLGIFGVVKLTSKPDKPKRVWADDDDDDRPKRRGTFGAGVDEGAVHPQVVKNGQFKPVKLDLHVMSKCPFGVQVENTLAKVRESLGAAVDVNIEFIGKVDSSGELQSLHGKTEVTGDLFQVCAEKHASKWYDALVCQNKDVKQVDTNWDACAVEAGVPPEQISAVDLCATGQEGKDLLTASFAKSSGAKASGSPTIFINGAQYQGGRTVGDFTRKICNEFPAAARPSECDNIPPVVPVDVQILTDARCSDCKPDALKRSISGKFAGAKITVLDYLDPAGAALWSTVRPNKLPLAVLEAVAETDPDGAPLLKSATKVGSSFVLSSGKEWNPECADTGGCARSECAGTLECRPETPGTLDLYVMSHCPFAAKGLVALKEVMKNFHDNGSHVVVSVHYIGDEKTPGVFTSLHGATEVEDDEREACVAKYYPRNFLDYLYCRAADQKGPWASCTGVATGFDQGTIAACASGADGTALLSKSFADSKAMGIGSSPTWVANGKYKFSGIDAETIKDNICKHNKLSGCNVTLSGPPPRPAPKPAPTGIRATPAAPSL